MLVQVIEQLGDFTLDRNLVRSGYVVAAIGRSAGRQTVGAFAANIEFCVLQQGLCCFEGALVVGVVAHDHFVEQRSARGPQRQQHGQYDENKNDKQCHTSLPWMLSKGGGKDLHGDMTMRG